MADRKRLLNDLRVIDLRVELEKRNLDKTGVRGVLVQRLAKFLELEGQDPTTFKFDYSGPESKTPSKRARRTDSTVEQESEDTPTIEDMIIQDDVGDDDEVDTSNETSKNGSSELNMDSEETSKPNRKRETAEKSEASNPKKLCLKNELKPEEDHKADVNTDAEDSINLDIGDDELLNDESENTTKAAKTDDGGGDQEETGEAERYDPELGADAETDDAAHDSQAHVNDEAAPTSCDGDKNGGEAKDDASKTGESDKKDKKDDLKEGGARNLWVSGLSGDTRAKDLKQLCSKFGKVIGAKVVTNAKTPGSRCYGYVTMASPQDAENCIKNLHRTELHGRMISVEKAKSESESASRRQPVARIERRPSKEEKLNEENKEGGEKNDIKKKDDEEGEEKARSRSRDKSQRSDKQQDRVHRSPRSRDRRRSPREVLSFSKIWKERDAARARERSREAFAADRHRRQLENELRERERKQREEKRRLDIEREKLRAEREKIEREKNELLRLERERHRLEREKLELERLELKRAQLRLEEERRKRYESNAYRKSPPAEYERHKRVVHPPHVPPSSSSRGQFEAPPPPRFETPASYDRTEKRERDQRDYKRDYVRHVPSGNIKYPSNGTANDDTRQPLAPGTRPKEPSRSYDSREARSYRPSPPTKPESRSWNSSRYPDTTSNTKGNSNSENWSMPSDRYGSSGVGSGAGYEPPAAPRYGHSSAPHATPAYAAAPMPSYADRYAPQARQDYRKF